MSVLYSVCLVRPDMTKEKKRKPTDETDATKHCLPVKVISLRDETKLSVKLAQHLANSPGTSHSSGKKILIQTCLIKTFWWEKRQQKRFYWSLNSATTRDRKSSKGSLGLIFLVYKRGQFLKRTACIKYRVVHLPGSVNHKSRTWCEKVWMVLFLIGTKSKKWNMDVLPQRVSTVF